MEVKIYSRMEELGITESMIWDQRDKGGRSAVIGTYRILMYRAYADQVENNNNTSDTEKQQNSLQLPATESQASSSKSVRSNKSSRSKKSSIISSAPPSRRPSTSVPPTTLDDNNSEQEPMTTMLTVPTSPTKSKFKHKFNLSLLGSKKVKGNPKDKSSKKKMKVSKTCVIL